MANVLTIRKGAVARYEETHYNLWGNPIRTDEAVVTILGRPRHKRTERFCQADDYGAKVRVRDEKGSEYDVLCDCLSVYNTIWDLTHDELCQLRGQVCLGSCYTGDYRNTFGIDPHQVYDFCEGFGQSIGWSDDDDTPDNFADYCEGVERYEC